MLYIPHSDGWIVVERHVRDTTSRGQIMKPGLSKRAALTIAHMRNQSLACKDYNYWAMPREEF